MAKNKMLVVYNICGISGKDNSDYYVDAINTITSQDCDDYVLAVSACRNPDYQIKKILENCKVDFVNSIDDVLPVNITFNSTVREAVKTFGDFEAFLYLDSGVKFTSKDQLSKLFSLYESGNYGMVSAQVDSDFGWCWFGLNEYSKPILQEDLIIPVGKACNLHCQIFSNEIFNYYNNVLPDIFRSYCTESTFSFINAAIRKKWIVSSAVRVHHAFNVPDGRPDDGDGIDGHSSGFKAPPGTWDDVFPPHSMKEIIQKEDGTKYGFGYEELRSIKLHDPECFDLDGYCINEQLKTFLKENLFLKKENFNYDTINQKTYKRR
tara:strand:+ start:1044 stop:2006 length:963 start_codon:yes stop_codon:yes gene_type:complete